MFQVAERSAPGFLKLNFMPTLAEVQVRIGAEISQFQKGLRNAERELERTAGRFNNLGNNLSLAVSLPLAAAGAAAFKFAGQFETATVKLQNLVGVQGKELEDLKAKFQTLGPVVGKTQTELADAALFITGAGLRGAAALEALEISAKASAIGLGEQTAVAKVAGAAVAAYGEANITSTQAVDKLLAAVQQGNAEAADLAPVLGRVLPVAAQLGVSFDEVTANIALFTRLGISAEGAVDGLKSALTNVLKPSEQADKALATIGLTAQDVRDSIKNNGLAATLQDLVKAFGSNTDGLARVFGDVQGLVNILGTAGVQGKEYANVLAAIQNSAGGVDEAFKRTSETAEFKLQKAFAGLNAAGTQFGSIILPIVVDLANAVVPLAQGFASLDPTLQKLVVGFGLAAAAAGPLFKLVGTSIQTYSVARSAVLSFGKAMEVSKSTFDALAPSLGGVKAGLTAASNAWRALDTVAKGTVIGLAVATVVALGVAFYKLSDSMSSAAKVQATVNGVQNEAQKAIAAERIEAEKLVGIITSNNAKYSDKENALKRLNQISPEYFSGLKIEEGNYGAINTALDKYVASLLKAAQIKAAEGKIVELEKRRLDLLEAQNKAREKSQNRLLAESVVNQFLPAGANLGGGFQQLGYINAELAQIDKEQKALAQIAFNANDLNQKLKEQAVATAGAPLGVGAPLPTGKSGKAAKQDPIRAGLPGSFSFPDVSGGVQFNTDGVNEYSEAIDRLAERNDVLVTSQEGLANTNAALAEFSNQATFAMYEQAEAAEKLQNTYTALGEISQSVGAAIIATSESGKASLADYAKAVGNAARKAISAQIAEGVSAAVSKALAGAPFPANLILAPIAGATAAALFNTAIPKFAEGGIVTSPTLGVFGEAGPEAIFPLKDLDKFVKQNSGGGAVQVYGRLSGNDILLSSERSQGRRNRQSGY